METNARPPDARRGTGNGVFMLAGDLGRMSQADRAEWRKENARKKPAPKPKRKPAHEPAGFNAVQFHVDLMNAARQLAVNTERAVAKDAGVDALAVARLKRGLAPTLSVCLVLCEWAGLDPLRYIIRLAPLAANDSSARAAA